MDLIPIPQEQEIQKVCKLKILRTRILEKAKTQDDKNLMKASAKLTKYIEDHDALTPEESSELPIDLHRAILIIQKRKKRGIN